MAARDTRKRDLTAKQLSMKTGFSDRTIRRFKAESRESFESRAEERRLNAYTLRIIEKKSWKEVAELMDTTIYSVQALVKRYKQNHI